MAAEPRIWILSRGRKGDLDQMLALAKATGWPFEVKTLRFAGPEIPVLSHAAAEATRARSPPWPDLVLCAEASPSVIAREIKRQSRRPDAHRLPRQACGLGRRISISSSPPRNTAFRRRQRGRTLDAAGRRWRSRPRGTRRTGPSRSLVGGPAFPDRLDAAAAERLPPTPLAYAARRNAVLDVQTSPRTPPEADRRARAPRSAPPHRLGVFGAGENRYRDALAEASEIVVTSDSVSMVSDALASGKPVSVYPLPQALNAQVEARRAGSTATPSRRRTR